MRTVETGRLSKPHQAGFTLIELLVSIAVVGILLAVIVLNVNLVSDSRDLQTEAKRFAALLEVAEEDAVLQGREFGVELMNGAYRFVEYDVFAEQWQEIIGDDTLRLRNLPETYLFELFLEDKKVLLDDAPAPFDNPDSASGITTAESYAPHLLVYSSGDIMPFEIHVWREFDRQRIVLTRDATGSFELNAADES